LSVFALIKLRIFAEFMRTIILAFVLVASSGGNEWTDSEIARLTEANKKVAVDLKAAEQRMNLVKGDKTAAKSVVSGYRRSMGINSEAIRLLKLEALDRPSAPVKLGAGEVYAPRFVIVPETNAPPAAKQTNQEPAKDWRTPEQRARWESIGTNPPQRILPPKPATRVKF
jgi:hypothetical protein